MRRAHRIGWVLIAALCRSGAPVLAADFQVGNVSSYAGNKRWDWTVFITAPKTVLDRIRCVEYTLHPTFPDPVQVVCDRGTNDSQAFPLKMSSWGTSDVGVKVMYRDGKSDTTKYTLKLQEPSPSLARAALCRVLAQRSLTADDFWPLPDPFRPLYLYVDELPRSGLATVIVFNTRSSLDSRTFDWDNLKDHLRQVKDNQPLADETYVKVKAGSDTLSAVQRSNGPPVQFFVSKPVRGTSQIGLCDARR